MLALTRKTDYAIIALTHLAQNSGLVCTAREIAEKFHIPTALLMNVLKTLNQGELVRSVRGAKGGYSLALPPAHITLEQIIRVVEGPIRFVQCSNSSGDDPTCELTEICPVRRPVQRIQVRLENFLRQITLADILRDAFTEARPETHLTIHGGPCTPAGCCRSSEAIPQENWIPGETVRPV